MVYFILILQSEVFLRSSTKNMEEHYHGNSAMRRPLQVKVNRLNLSFLDSNIIDYPGCNKHSKVFIKESLETSVCVFIIFCII